MENWREGTRSGHTHEPNDVTVQLDGLGRQLSELPVEPGSPEHSDGPVFVDESGRRSKTYRRLGWILATICAIYAVTLVVAVVGGNSTAPWLPLSGHEDDKPAVEVKPAPSDDQGKKTESPAPLRSSYVSADPAATSVLRPPGRASGSASATPSADASSSASLPPKGHGKTTTKANPTATPDTGKTDDSPSPVVSTPVPTVSTTPPSTDPDNPPVQGQESAH